MLSEVLPERIYHICVHCCPSRHSFSVGALALPPSGHHAHYRSTNAVLCLHLVAVWCYDTAPHVSTRCAVPIILVKTDALIDSVYTVRMNVISLCSDVAKKLVSCTSKLGRKTQMMYLHLYFNISIC